jgi:hypothetical protein
MATKFEHEYRGWKIRITGHTAGAGWSAMIEVWEPGQDPGQDPGNHPGIIVPFRKRLPSEAEARAVALVAARKWVDRGVGL